MDRVTADGTGSVTRWVGRLQAGDREAAQWLWERYALQLAQLARRKLRGTACRAADEEDVALSAFDSFCRRAEQGRFVELQDRDNLWRLLVVLTARKAVDLVKHERRQKRGAGSVCDEAALGDPTAFDHRATALDQIIGREPTPEFAAQMAEECERLLQSLDDEGLRSVALWKMHGYTNAEIATRLGRAPRAVERMLQLIRRIWAEEELP